ncbi:MAG: PAS domain S-box protein [Myxococcales bacterium]|nr:PAS domain S-box protein [Myxococcales bacterium]
MLVLIDDADLRASLVEMLEELGVPALGRDAEGARGATSADPDTAATSVLASLTAGDCVVLLAARSPAETLAELRGFREDPRLTHVPVLVVARDEEVASLLPGAFELGADDLLRHPFPPAELLARVSARFLQRGAVDALAHDKHDAEVMLELTQALASSLDFREILYTVVRRIADVVHVSRVSIVLAPEPDQGDVGYVVVASDDERLSNLRLDLTKYPEIRQVLRTREALTITDAHTHPVLDGVRQDVEQAELSAMNLFPIVWEEQAIGVLFLRAHAARGELSPREMHLCRVLANATAVALRNARVMQSLRDHTQQITFARFEAERRLRQLKRYADLFASAAEGIAAADKEGHLLFANPRAHEIIGAEAGAAEDEHALRGATLLERVHPDDQERIRALWRGFARGEYPRGVDIRLRHEDGDYIVCSCSFASLADGDGAVLVSFQDVTEQRRTEAEFVKTMEFLESLIDASVDGIVASDMDGNIILFNQGAERIYGWRAEEVVGRMSVHQLYPGDGAKEVMRKLKGGQHGGAGRLAPTHMEALGRNGERIPIRLSAAMIYERNEPVATFGIFTDLREKLRVEERLAEAQQKLASTERQALIAELAGTAAHELNQPLTSVMAYAELLKRRLEPGTAEYRAAEIMVREAERMADIVKKIGKMTKYETKSYVGRQRILDLDRASNDEEAGETGET